MISEDEMLDLERAEDEVVMTTARDDHERLVADMAYRDRRRARKLNLLIGCQCATTVVLLIAVIALASQLK